MAFTVEEPQARSSVPRPRANSKAKEPHYNTGPLEYSSEYLAQCKLERHEPGRVVTMQWPDADGTIISIPSETLVRTKGSALAMGDDFIDPEHPKNDDPEAALHKTSPRACGHFSHDRVCLRGARCYFLHALCIRPPSTNDARFTAKEQHRRDYTSANRGQCGRVTMPKQRNKAAVPVAAPATAMPNFVFPLAPQWHILPQHQQQQVFMTPQFNMVFAPAAMPGAAIPMSLLMQPQQVSQPVDQSFLRPATDRDGLSVYPLFFPSLSHVPDVHQASVANRARAQASW